IRPVGARGETRTHDTGFAIQRLSHLATRAKLERKERFELSRRVWKTRMFPATSLPRRIIAAKKHKRFLCFCAFLWLKIWSGRTESNCHHEFPGLGCERYTTPRN